MTKEDKQEEEEEGRGERAKGGRKPRSQTVRCLRLAQHDGVTEGASSRRDSLEG